MKRYAALAFGAVGLAAACGEGLPIVERIASTRPLAMRVQVEDAAADPEAPTRAEALPFEVVRLVPFIVDEHGPLTPETIANAIEPMWLSCALQPVEGLFACLSSKVPLTPEEVVACPPVSIDGFDPQAGTFPPVPSPCVIEAADPALPLLTVPLDIAFLLGGDLEVTMVGHVPGEGTTQRCLEEILSDPQKLDESCLVMTQRVPIGPDGRLLELAQEFGIDDISQFGVIPDEIPDPDTNPRIETFAIQVFDQNGGSVAALDVDRGGIVDVQLGHRIEIETTAPESDLQTYLIPQDTTTFVERTETYSGRWFRTWGDLLSPTSDDPRSINTWTLRQGPQDEAVMPPNDATTLFYVLRDDRQGVDWWWFNVNVLRSDSP